MYIVYCILYVYCIHIQQREISKRNHRENSRYSRYCHDHNCIIIIVLRNIRNFIAEGTKGVSELVIDQRSGT